VGERTVRNVLLYNGGTVSKSRALKANKKKKKKRRRGKSAEGVGEN